MPEDELFSPPGIGEGTGPNVGYKDVAQATADLDRFMANSEREEERVSIIRKILDTDSNVFKKAMSGPDLSSTLAFMDNSIDCLYFPSLKDDDGFKLKDKVIGIIGEEFDAVDRGLEEYPNPVATSHAISLVTRHVTSNIDKTSPRETDLRARELDFISTNLGLVLPADSMFDTYEPTDLVMSIGSHHQVERIRNIFMEQATSDDPAIRRGDCIFNVVPYLIRSEDSYISYEAKSIVSEYIDKHMGLSPRLMFEQWYMSNRNYKNFGPKVGEIMIGDNFRDLYALEQERPGIGKVLSEEFGVYDVARYPKDLLIRQYDEKDNKDLKYGIAIYGEDDHNGAFYQNDMVLESLSNQLGEEYALRIYEVTDKTSLVAVLNKARKRYGRASFAILAAHGSGDGMFFGRNDSQPSIPDVNRGGAKALRHAFINDPTIILFSCSTGKLGGIGDQIATLGGEGTRVIAPDYNTSPRSIEVKKEDGKLKFEVEYIPPEDFKD